jgi:REP element-mobilizing transposase RayT
MLIMPDHLHLIATFDLSRGIQVAVTTWKGYQAKTVGVDWQAGFFEHRLRNDKEYLEKACYIRMNPVRKGLVISAEEWPYVIDRSNIIIKDGLAGTPRPTI